MTTKWPDISQWLHDSLGLIWRNGCVVRWSVPGCESLHWSQWKFREPGFSPNLGGNELSNTTSALMEAWGSCEPGDQTQPIDHGQPAETVCSLRLSDSDCPCKYTFTPNSKSTINFSDLWKVYFCLSCLLRRRLQILCSKITSDHKSDS